jgi:hypothetical protein
LLYRAGSEVECAVGPLAVVAIELLRALEVAGFSSITGDVRDVLVTLA